MVHDDNAAVPSADPWGQPYRVNQVNGRIVRVLSSGPNMSSPDVGTDDDDIYSDMSVSPAAAICAQKNRQWLIALGAAAGTWLVLTIVYLRVGRTFAK